METMVRPPRSVMGRALLQALALAVTALVLAAVSNEVRPGRLAWRGDWSPAQVVGTVDGENLVVSLPEARDLFFSGSGVFLDARSPALYAEGHIQGAINLPWDEYDEMATDVLSSIPKEATIIAYCDGEGCGLSRELAVALLAAGYKHVRILVNGWSVWQENGLPVAVGTADPWG